MWPWSRNRAATDFTRPPTAEEREAREETRRLNAEYLLETWREEHPLRLWHVYYALADGRVTNQHNPEKVWAHRRIIEAMEGTSGTVAVVMFLRVEPVSDGYAVEEKCTAILVVPFDRVHSINLQPEREEE